MWLVDTIRQSKGFHETSIYLPSFINCTEVLAAYQPGQPTTGFPSSQSAMLGCGGCDREDKGGSRSSQQLNGQGCGFKLRWRRLEVALQ